MLEMIEKFLLQSFLYNFNSSSEFIKINDESKVINKFNTDDNFFIKIIFLWIFMYSVYEKCLNILLRRMKIGMISRRRMIDALWCCGFTISSMFYLEFLLPESLDSACVAQKPKYLELGFVLHKSFYLHRAISQIFTQNCWLQGSSNLLFCLIIHSSSDQKSFDIVIKLLFWKASIIAIINSCQIVYSVKSFKTSVVKLLLAIYSLNWMYIVYTLVPDFKISNSKGLKNDWPTLFCMWIWLFSELFNEVQKMYRGYKSKTVESFLFAPPSNEMIQLRNICKKLRESSNPEYSEVPNNKKMSELWQTLSCAIVMKKKVKRMRESKANASSSSSSTTETN